MGSEEFGENSYSTRSPQIRRRGIGGPLALPSQVDLPAGLDPVLADLIGTLNSPDLDDWVSQVWGVGGCSHPIHLRGWRRVRDSVTGQVREELHTADLPGGVLLMRCGNRRASVCPSCASIYSADIYHLVRAGLAGGRGIPETVSGHPRVFATLTAPSFGAVHRSAGTRGGGQKTCHPRRSGPCPHGRATACFARHDENDELTGTPLCGDCYDYPGAVIWQASVAALWERFRIYLPRHLGALGGRTRAQVLREVRLSYVKVVEFQTRGLVHVHAVIRADANTAGEPEDDREGLGADGLREDAPGGRPVMAPPAWVTSGLLERAVRSAARDVRLDVLGGSAGSWTLGWGRQLDVHDISAGSDAAGAGRVAGYLAKYTSKSTEVVGWDPTGRTDTLRARHAAAMVAAAVGMRDVPELAPLGLGMRAAELGYRGHVSSKSRSYSTTLTALRQERAQYRADAAEI